MIKNMYLWPFMVYLYLSNSHIYFYFMQLWYMREGIDKQIKAFFVDQTVLDNYARCFTPGCIQIP